MRDQEYSVIFPWQPEKLLPKRNSISGRRGNSSYNEWPCEYPSCTVMLNDVAVKNRRRRVCPDHEKILKRKRDSERWKKWYAHKQGEKMLAIFMQNLQVKLKQYTIVTDGISKENES